MARGIRPTFRAAPVRVRVPATSANLGPGFDALGLALTLYDEVEAPVTAGRVPGQGAGGGAGDPPAAGGVRVGGTGEGEDARPADERPRIVRAIRHPSAPLGEQPAGLALRCR